MMLSHGVDRTVFAPLIDRLMLIGLLILCGTGLAAAMTDSARHPVPREHPRLLGSRARLQKLARERPDAYARTAEVARHGEASDWANEHAKMVSMALICAIEEDEEIGRQAVAIAMKYVDGPIRVGHVTFGHDLAHTALVYDLCFEYWSEEERSQYHNYVNNTVTSNVGSETSPMSNGYYAYKWQGIGLAAYATYYENERAPEILATLEEEFRTRGAPALERAGNGGGWAEGYYINYWLYDWLFFCEAARYCEGVDYYEMAPGFFRNRAVASMFEVYPDIRIYGSRRSIPMGDGGSRIYGGDRDKTLSSRRILASHYRDNPAHQVVHTFNESTPRSASGDNAYKDFLWRDTTVKKGDLQGFKLSHYSPGAGYVYARSSWEEDATYFFFKVGDRFTSHQHLDQGHFLIYKYEELAGDGGHFYAFDSEHDVNYLLRSIAHNTILVHDPDETWPNDYYGEGIGIRAGKVTGNDGGQHHNWPHHNGNVEDASAWERGRDLYDIGDILAFEDRGSYLYVAGDATRAYSANKLEHFTRQIVFIRPGTFVVFDRVKSTDPRFRKSWVLQAMKPPSGEAPNLVITNGAGRLFVQTVLPVNPQVQLARGAELYSYGGRDYPPERDTGPAPECRVEISPTSPAKEDFFLHVLTATGATVTSVPQATTQVTDTKISVAIGETKISFAKGEVAMRMEAATAVEEGNR